MKMPRYLIVSLLSVGLAAPAVAADMAEPTHHGAMPAHTNPATPLSDGLVKKVDKAAGKLTLTHGPLPNGMPGMTMAFRVKDASWLDQVQVGQKIRFALDDKMIIIRLEPAQ